MSGSAFAAMFRIACLFPLFLFLLTPSAFGLPDPDPSAGNGTEEPAPSPACIPPPPGSPDSDVEELFRAIRENSPELYRRISGRPRAELLQKILDAMDSGVTLTKEPPAVSGEADRKPEIWTGRLLEDRRILYLRLDAMTQETFDSLQNECFASVYHSPSAVVLDLRRASGRDPESYRLLPRFLSLFTDSVPPENLRTEYFRTRPAAVLTSAETVGAPALLAASLGREKRIVTAGRAGRESVFPCVEAEAAGYRFRIPVIPAGQDAEVFLPAPMLSGDSVPILYGSLGDPAAISGDRVLRSSMDLLLALSSLGDSGGGH